MFSPQYGTNGNESSQYFTFENRQVNNQLNNFKDFLGIFVTPRLPGLNWKRVARQVGQNQAAAPPELRNPNGQTPADPAKRR